MAEYIEREKAINSIAKIIGKVKCHPLSYEITDDERVKCGLRMAQNALREQPTADVQEVRHGKNVTEMHPVDEFECSECGFICEISEKIYDDEYTFDCYREYNPKFCPNCGAKMDKE